MRSRGFSLLELVVVVAVLGLLAALIAPTARNLILDSKAQRIVEVADTLRKACQRHWIDTGTPAVELAIGTPSGISIGGFSPPTRHLLYANDSLPHWKGPYIPSPLTVKDLGLEEGSGAFVFDNLAVAGSGFQLEGAAGPTTNGTGNCLVITDIETDLAKLIDDALDKTTLDADRPIFGRVTYQTVQNSTKVTVFIFLLSSP